MELVPVEVVELARHPCEPIGFGTPGVEFDGAAVDDHEERLTAASQRAADRRVRADVDEPLRLRRRPEPELAAVEESVHRRNARLTAARDRRKVEHLNAGQLVGELTRVK